MLIDSGALFTSTVNPKLLDDTVHDPEGLNMSTNVGQKSMNHKGEMVGLKAKAWTDKEGVANAFSLADLADQCHVTHDNAKEDTFNVESWEDDKDKVSIKFPRDEASRPHGHRFLADCINGNGLPMRDEHDLEEIDKRKHDRMTNSVTQLLDMVAENRKNFSVCEFE